MRPPASGGDVRLLPAVHQIPRRLEAAAAARRPYSIRVHRPGHVGSERLPGQPLAWFSPQLVPAEITAEPLRRGDRHVPVAANGKRLRQAAVDGDGVGVPDREKTPSPRRDSHATRLAAGRSAASRMIPARRRR